VVSRSSGLLSFDSALQAARRYSRRRTMSRQSPPVHGNRLGTTRVAAPGRGLFGLCTSLSITVSCSTLSIYLSLSLCLGVGVGAAAQSPLSVMSLLEVLECLTLLSQPGT
jgi:hypothetical protein